MTFDSEDLLDLVLGLMKDGGALNAQIAAVEAEKSAAGKGLDPALAPINDLSYYAQTWTDKILNSSPSIFYGIEDVQALDGAGAVAKTYQLFVEVCLVDENNAVGDSWKRIARYARALEEVFRKSFAPALGHGNVKITAMRPIAFKLALDSDDEVKIGGISLTVNLV